MWRVGFEPTKALSHKILSLAPLTAREPPHKIPNKRAYKKLYKPIINYIFGDDHTSQETPVLFPTTEVKLIGL